MPTKLEGLSTRAQLEAKARALGLKSPDAFFARDDIYKTLRGNDKEIFINNKNNLSRYASYVDYGEKGKKQLEEYERLQEKNRKADINPISAGLTSFAEAVPGGSAIIELTSSPQELENRRSSQAEHPVASTVGGIGGNIGSGIAMGGGVAGGIKKLLPKVKPIVQAAVGGAATGLGITATTEGVKEAFDAKKEDRDYDAGKIARNAGINALSNIVALPVQHAKNLKPLKRLLGGAAADAAANAAGSGTIEYLETGEVSPENVLLSGALGAGMALGGGYGDYKAATKKGKPKNIVEKVPEEAAEPKKTDFLEGWKKLQEQSTAKPDDVIYADGDNPKQVGVEQKLIEQKKHEVIPKKHQLTYIEGEKPTVDILWQGVGDRPQKFAMGDGKFEEVAGREVPNFVLPEYEQSIKNLQELNAKMQKEADGYKSNEKVQKAFEESIAENEAEIARLREEKEKLTAEKAAPDNTVTDYENSIDSDLVEFAESIISGKVKNPNSRSYSIGGVTQRAAADIKNLTGIDVSDFDHNIKGNNIQHIDKGHGANGTHDHSMADLEDLGRIKYVLDNYDKVELSNDKNWAIRNSDNTSAKTVVYSKKVNGNYYIVEVVPDTKKHNLEIITVYKTKSGGEVESVLDITSYDVPQQTSETFRNTSPAADNNIQKADIKSQGEAVKLSKDIIPQGLPDGSIKYYIIKNGEPTELNLKEAEAYSIAQEAAKSEQPRIKPLSEVKSETETQKKTEKIVKKSFEFVEDGDGNFDVFLWMRDPKGAPIELLDMNKKVSLEEINNLDWEAYEKTLKVEILEEF